MENYAYTMNNGPEIPAPPNKTKKREIIAGIAVAVTIIAVGWLVWLWISPKIAEMRLENQKQSILDLARSNKLLTANQKEEVYSSIEGDKIKSYNFDEKETRDIIDALNRR